MLGLAEWVEALICGVSLGSSLCTTHGPVLSGKTLRLERRGPTPGHQKKGKWQIRSDEDVEHHLFFFFFFARSVLPFDSRIIIHRHMK